MSYSLYDNDYGGSLSAEYVMKVNIFLAKNAEMTYLDEAFTVLNNAMNTLVTSNHIEGYNLHAYDTDHALDCNNKESSGNSFLDANGFSGPSCNFWLTKCDVAVGYNNAWTRRTQAFLGTDRYSADDKRKNMYIQEVFHSFINSNCEHVRNLQDNTDDEHILGKVYKDVGASPMVTSYVLAKNFESRGDCQSAEYTTMSNYVQTLTDCTEDAVYLSWQHEIYKPDPHW